MVTEVSRPSSNEGRQQRILKYNSPVKGDRSQGRSAKKSAKKDRMSSKKLRQFTTTHLDKSKSPVKNMIFQTQDQTKIPIKPFEGTQRSIPNTTDKKSKSPGMVHRLNILNESLEKGN